MYGKPIAAPQAEHKPHSEHKPLQFTLRSLLVAMLGCAFLCALLFQWGLTGFIVCALGGGAAALAYGAYWSRPNVASVGLMLMVVGAFISLLAVLMCGREMPRVSSCSNNLRQIGLALQNYHDTYKSFPPAYIADQRGRPIHSWRVLLLPFMEQQQLYAQYRFDEPWDGPNNRKLASQIPDIYHCPSDDDAADFHTSYLVVVGPETMWPGAKALDMADIKDGSSNTVAVVESHGSGIHWMEPRDLHTLQMPMCVNPQHGQGLCSCHGWDEKSGRGTIAQFVRVDGSVGQFTSDTPPAEIRAALTRAARD